MLTPEKRFVFTLCLLVFLTVLVSFIFLTYPELDIYLSSLFFKTEGGFRLNSDPSLVFMRWFYNVEIGILCVTPAIMAIVARIASDKMIVPAKFWDFVLASFVLGPLVLVNFIFKSNWGRARPAEITEFGGSSQFTPPYFITDQCNFNCSFVSGEGSAIATSGIILGILFAFNFQKYRVLNLTLITLVSVFGISLRFVKGRHFASDSLLAMLFCALIILLLYRFMKIGDIREKIKFHYIFADLKQLFTFKRS